MRPKAERHQDAASSLGQSLEFAERHPARRRRPYRHSICGRLTVGKSFCEVDAVGSNAAMWFGQLLRRKLPLALMRSAATGGIQEHVLEALGGREGALDVVVQLSRRRSELMRKTPHPTPAFAAKTLSSVALQCCHRHNVR